MLTRDDVIRLAREAGIEPYDDDKTSYESETVKISVLESFAAAAYAAGQASEREECAMVCDAHTVDDVLAGVGIAKSCAAIIRARGENGGA